MRRLVLAAVAASLLIAPVRAAGPVVIDVDFGAAAGRWNPDLNGVNHGPLHVVNPSEAFQYRSVPRNWIDLSSQYRAAGLTWVRTDEIAAGDITTIFPHGPAADPDNPANYYFENVDVYLKAAIDAGAQIVFRVGYSDNNSLGYIVPPLSNERYTKIALNILRHFNEGWANGHHFGIKYVELWNEPDLTSQAGVSALTWVGTVAQFAELYRVFSTTLKAHDPTLMVGGYGAAHRVDSEFARQWLPAVAASGAPLDFFSWHHYSPTPDVLRGEAVKVRAALDAHGFVDTQSVITEWAGSAGNYNSVAEASMYAGTLALLQDGLVDIAAYYTGSPFVITKTAADWGMFEPTLDATPRPNYYAAQQYSWLSTQTPVRVAAGRGPGTAPVMAGVSEDGRLAQVVVNTLGSTERDVRLVLRGLVAGQYRVEVLGVDAFHNNSALQAPYEVDVVDGSAVVDLVGLEAPSLAFVRLTSL